MADGESARRSCSAVRRVRADMCVGYYPHAADAPQSRRLSCRISGTAIMLFIGVSAVAFMWAPASPVPVVPNPVLRRLLTGILFAGGATAVVYSPLGQISGAHINPAVTFAFWRLGKVPSRDAVMYV